MLGKNSRKSVTRARLQAQARSTPAMLATKMEERKQRRFIDAWNGMRVDELSTRLHCSLDEIDEVVRRMRSAAGRPIATSSSIGGAFTLDDKTIVNVARHLGYGVSLVANPTKVIEKELVEACQFDLAPR